MAAEHELLVRGLARLVAGYGHAIVRGVTTETGKRPDLVSIDTAGRLVIWEAKTRFTIAERRATWEKYASSADMLWLAFPYTTDLTLWHRPGWLTTDHIDRKVGALLWREERWLVYSPPALLKPLSTHRRPLLLKVQTQAYRSRSSTSAAV